jgi:hypothetical protein
MLIALLDQTGPARGAAAFGAALELAAAYRMRRRLGMLAEPYHTGRSGRLTRAAEILTAVGGLTGAVAGGRNRVLAAAAGAALLTGSASACSTAGRWPGSGPPVAQHPVPSAAPKVP